jgi:hypothetical protein
MMRERSDMSEILGGPRAWFSKAGDRANGRTLVARLIARDVLAADACRKLGAQLQARQVRNTGLQKQYV